MWTRIPPNFNAKISCIRPKTQPVILPTPPYYAIIKGLNPSMNQNLSPNPVDSPLASIPAMICLISSTRRMKSQKRKALQTFILGIASVLPILLYKFSWKYIPQVNIFNYTSTMQTDIIGLAKPYTTLGSVLAFMFVGVIGRIYETHCCCEG